MHTHEPTANGHGATGASAGKCPFHGGAPAVGLADTLKARTQDAHTRAERHPLQARLVKGEATREQYGAWLGQMHHVWRAVDAGVAALAKRDPRAGAMLKPYHAHAARLAADLAFLGQCQGCHAPTPATARFVEFVQRAAASRGPDILGVWYVLEGSANGGRYIAKGLSRGLGIAGPEGLTSLDPHGERQREYWQTWRAALDAQRFTDAERDAIVAAAAGTFDGVYDVMEGLESVGAKG